MKKQLYKAMLSLSGADQDNPPDWLFKLFYPKLSPFLEEANAPNSPGAPNSPTLPGGGFTVKGVYFGEEIFELFTDMGKEGTVFRFRLKEGKTLVLEELSKKESEQYK